MAADAGLKAEVESLRLAILAAGRAQADTADPTLRQLALAAFDRARIAEDAAAEWRTADAALFAALEARGYMEGDVPKWNAPPAPAGGPIDG